MAFPWRAKFSSTEATDDAFTDHSVNGGTLLVLTGWGRVAVDFHLTEGEYPLLSWQGQSHVTSRWVDGEGVGVLISNGGDGRHADRARTWQMSRQGPVNVTLMCEQQLPDHHF